MSRSFGVPGVSVADSGEIVFESGIIVAGGVSIGSFYDTGVLVGDQTDLVIPDISTYPLIIFRSSGNIKINSIVAPIQGDISKIFQQVIFYNGNDVGGGVITFVAGGPGAAVNTFEMFADIKQRPRSPWDYGYDFEINRFVGNNII